MFHIAAIFETNEFELDFPQFSPDERLLCVRNMYRAVVLKALELGDQGGSIFEKLMKMLELFSIHIETKLNKTGRREAEHAF